MKRAIIVVLDSFGIGASEDADRFGDAGANTLGHIAEACAAGQCDTRERGGPLALPNLTRLGLGKVAEAACGRFPAGLNGDADIIGAHGYAREISSGKDTPSGHWELAGVPVLFEWGYFKDKHESFPLPLLERIVERAGLPGYLGNCHASGTDILDALGGEHLRTGKPIFYTSVDSVFQIACHEQSFGLERLLDLCHIVREELAPYNIGRVIARPFTGNRAGEFQRTGNRRDLSLPPPSPTVLQKLVGEKGGQVISVGKIADIFAGCGITTRIKATGTGALIDATLEQLRRAGDNCLIFTNLVDFDAVYGHRRNVAGYAAELEYFDRRLPEVLALLAEGDLLIVTADHGCDPTWRGTDHTRELIPVLLYGPGVPPLDLGRRETFADVGQTLARYFGISPMDYGQVMLEL